MSERLGGRLAGPSVPLLSSTHELAFHHGAEGPPGNPSSGQVNQRVPAEALRRW